MGWNKNFKEVKTVYGDSAPKKTAVYKWIKRFKEGREEIIDDSRTGRPASSKTEGKIADVQELIAIDRRMTVQQIAEAVDISYGSAQSILHNDLGLSKQCARWVPKMLQPHQKNIRCELSTAILTMINFDEEIFLRQLVTGDETWIYQYDPETKRQSKEWLPRGSSAPIKFKTQRSGKKVMATVFWDSEGVILLDFLEGKTTVTGAYYVEVLKKLKAAIIKKRPGKLHNGILFHHDNAPAHSAKITKNILREFRWQLLPHPPYSPDLAPSHFFCSQN